MHQDIMSEVISDNDEKQIIVSDSHNSSDTKSNKVYREDVLAIPYSKEESVCKIEFCYSKNSNNSSFASEEIVFTDGNNQNLLNGEDRPKHFKQFQSELHTLRKTEDDVSVAERDSATQFNISESPSDCRPSSLSNYDTICEEKLLQAKFEYLNSFSKFQQIAQYQETLRKDGKIADLDMIYPEMFGELRSNHGDPEYVEDFYQFVIEVS